MPVLTAEQIKTFTPPAKDPNRMRVALSHEFIELYRGDKDLRIGKILCEDYGCEVVHLGTDIPSPADSRIFKTKAYPVEELCPLPDDYHLLLMKTRMVWHRRGNISLGGFFRWTPHIVRQLLRWKPDLIFESSYLTLTPRSYQTFLASKLLGIPVAYVDPGDIIAELKLKNRLVLPVEKQVVNRVKAIITYNRAGKKRFMDKYGCSPQNIHVLPKPIDISRFNPNVDTRAFRERFGLEGKFVVGYFGRLSTNKGAKKLLEAASLLRQRENDKDIVFLFVGGNLEVDQASEFKGRMEELKLDNVKMTGMIPNSEMPQAYAGVDVAVFPDVTNLPGFSTVLSESMATALPIIIGIKGWEDAVPIVDGKNGLVIEPRHPQQIADSIERLRTDSDLRRKDSNTKSYYSY